MWFLPSLNIKGITNSGVGNFKLEKKYKLNKIVVKVTNILNNRALLRVANHLKKML